MRAVLQPTISDIAAQSGEVVRALVTVDATSQDLYSRQGTQMIGAISADSDLSLTDGLTISRFRYQPSSNRLVLNRNTGDDDYDNVLGTGNIGENAEFIFSTPYGTVTLDTGDIAPGNLGTNFVRLTMTQAQQDIFDELETGDMFNFVVGRFALAEQVQADALTGVPAVAAQVRTMLPLAEQVRTPITTGVPVAAATVRATLPGAAQVRGAATTGVPSALARVQAIHPNAGRIQAATESGVPLIEARVVLAIPGAGRTEAEAVSGVPVVTAGIRTSTRGERLGLLQPATYQTSRIDLYCKVHLGSDSDENRRNFIRWNFTHFRRSPTFWLPVGQMFWIAPPIQ